MKKVFSKEKFIEYEGMNEYLKCKAWVDECDGLTPEEMLKKRYIFSPSWMIEVDELACKKSQRKKIRRDSKEVKEK